MDGEGDFIVRCKRCGTEHRVRFKPVRYWIPRCDNCVGA